MADSILIQRIAQRLAEASEATPKGEGFWPALATIAANEALVPIVPERVCDINTEDDWVRAEAMYAALKQKEAT